ncbi:Rib/alpha-like domain-containing protein [Lactobacillus gasseri]|uniref:Rib/alpha-like domain-containing protein n=1 Tax=Lactobacillus gasseri TaxID=1596 RepID=UPI003B7ACF51
MLSRKNYQERLRKMEPKKERFSIRKFTVGAASVLIGFSFMGMSNSEKVQAADVNANSKPKVELTSKNEASEANKEQANTEAEKQAALNNNQVDQSTKAKTVANNEVKSETAATKAETTKTETAKVSDNKKVETTELQLAKATTRSNDQTQNVTDTSSFINALKDANVGHIVLSNNIDFSQSNASDLNVDNTGSARAVTIEGKGHQLDFGQNAVTFNRNNQTNTTPIENNNWNITLDNVTIGSTGAKGIFDFSSLSAVNAAKNAVTFKNVTSTADTNRILSSAVNANFSGVNNFNSKLVGDSASSTSLSGTLSLSGALFKVNSLSVLDGTTTINVNNQKGDTTAFEITNGNAVVKSGATLNISSESANFGGIYFDKGAGTQDIDAATVGVTRLESGAVVNMDLGTGRSMAIMNGSHLDLQDGSQLNINTKINTKGFRAYAPINLDSTGNITDSTLRVGKDAILKVIRAGVIDSDSPLVAMGPTSGNGQTYHFEVNGGSLILHDSAYSSLLPDQYTLAKAGKYGESWPGLLTMWGTSSYNYVNFTDAKYIDLERNSEGHKAGYLVHLEAAANPSNTNQITITNSTANGFTPLTMIPAGESNPVTWQVKSLSNLSQGGTNSYAFRAKGKGFDASNTVLPPYTYGSEYMNGSGNAANTAGGTNTVTLADGGEFANGAVQHDSDALQQFINHFSWWNTNGVKFGSDLIDNNQYQPAYDPMNVKQGESKSEDPKYVTSQEGNITINPDGKAPEGTKYAKGDASQGFVTVDPDSGKLTIAPTSENSKTGLVLVPVEVTYPDSTKDVVNVPVYIGDGTHTGTITKDENGKVTGAYEVVTDISSIKAHETSDHSQVLNAGDAVSKINHYTINTDAEGKETVSEPTAVEKSNATIEWQGSAPSTVVTTPSASENLNGTVQVTVNGTEVNSNKLTIPAAGATAKDVSTPIEVVVGQELTDEQARELIDTSSLAHANIHYTATWATAPSLGDTNATIKLTFDDEYASGKKTYLNVVTKDNSIKVVPTANDADKYEPSYNPIGGRPGQTVTTDVHYTPTLPDSVKPTYKLGDNAPAGAEVDPNTGKVSYTIPSGSDTGVVTIPVTVTYPDNTAERPSVDHATATVVVVKPQNVTKPSDPTNNTYKPSDGIHNPNNLPEGTTITWRDNGTDPKPFPDKPETQVIKVTVPGKNNQPGTTVYVPVTVGTPGDTEIIYGTNTTTSYTIGTYTAHKTTDGSVENIPVPAITEITFKNEDSEWNATDWVTYKLEGNTYKITEKHGNPTLNNGASAPESFSANDVTTKWMENREPNTNVANYGDKTGSSLASQQTNSSTDQRTGEGDNLPGNSKTRATIHLTGTAKEFFGSDPNWINVFGNIYGATTGATETYKQGQDISGISQDAFRKLINVTDLGQAGWNGQNINPNAPQVLAYIEGTDNSRQFAMTWAPNGMPSTRDIQNNVTGTVRISFNDGTYLDVKANINVVADSNTDKPDDQKTSFSQRISYQFNGQEVASHTIADIAKGSSLTADQLKSAIDGNLPNNYSIADGYTYPAAENNINSQPAEIIVPLKQSQKQHDDSDYNAQVIVKYVDSTNNTPLKTKNGKDELTFDFNKKEGLKASTLKANIDNNIPAGWKVAEGFTYPGDQTDNNTITVKLVKNTVTPGEPGVTPDNPEYKDLFTTSTRTINVYKTDNSAIDHTEKQTITFGRTGVLDQYTGKIMEGSEGTWYVYNTTTNKLTSDKTGTWAEYTDIATAPQGYDYMIDGVKTTEAKVAAESSVGPNTVKTIDVKYVAQNSTPVPYDPSNKDMNMDVTRTIKYDVSGTGHAAIADQTQTVHYVRKDANGNAGYYNPVTGKTTWVAWTPEAGSAEFSAKNVEQISGFDSYVNGEKGTQAPVATITTKEIDGYATPQNGKTVTVTYKAVSPTEESFTQAIKYVDEKGQELATTADAFTGTFTSDNPATVSAEEIKNQIDNDLKNNSALKGWVVAGNYPVAETITEKNPAALTVTLKHGAKSVTPTTPTEPKYKDLFTSVSRDIYQTKPGEEEQLISTQTVNFGRNGVEDLVTGEVTGTGAWEVGKIENNKFVLGGEAEYPTAAVEQISGYDSYVNGTKATEVQSASAIKDGTPVNGEAIHITYQQSETPVADVTVSYQFYDTIDKKNVGNPIVVSGKPGTNAKTNLTIPVGYKLTADQTLPENVIIPTKNETVVINLVHATKDVTPTTPGVNPTEPKYKDMFTSVSRDIYQTKPGEEEQLISTQTVNFGRNGVEDLVTGKVTGTGAWEVGKIENDKFVLGGEAEYPTAAVEQISSYDSYVNGTKATEIQSASAIKDGTPVNGEAVHITYQKSSTATPYDPNNKDMNKDVVRTITVNKIDGTTETIVQTVHFVRGGEGENVEADTPWTVGVRDGNTWKSTGATEGTWPEYNVPQVTDYTSTVDGKDAKVVLADKNVNANTPNTNVVVAYTKTTTPTDADKYTPEGQDVHTTPGVVPPAEKGIKNKDDMPKGTKYTWEKTPDVTKPGKTTGTVIVTYPDGSKDKVDVPVIIDTPTTPTDADKYTPEGQDVHTTPGVVPPAEKGIKNKDDMPKGTKYTWEKTPDVTKPGKTTGTVIVTYPDGSKDKVDVPVIIDTPTTPTDADKYTPEGQDVHTTPGVVPNPSEGIKNKDDMPKGTKYTWEKTPDVTKPGKTTGTVIVTYPDGSKDKVDVPVIVDNPTTPTDADKYTPEGQDVHTTPGVVPPAEKGIKNKDDMPKGTKYTWEKTPDVTKPGKTTGTVIVTYPDGSKDKVNVTVIIGTNHVTPEPQPIHTTPGVVPNPSEGIKNKDDMPEGTKYTWKEVPDVSTIGEHTGVVTVTYPDGSSVDVTVKVYVDATGTSDNNSGKTTETNSEANTAKAATVNENHHAEKNTLPQTGAKSENTAGILGLAIATVGSLFGLGVDRKKRQK